jgi:hypothetical protein
MYSSVIMSRLFAVELPTNNRLLLWICCLWTRFLWILCIKQTYNLKVVSARINNLWHSAEVGEIWFLKIYNKYYLASFRVSFLSVYIRTLLNAQFFILSKCFVVQNAFPSVLSRLRQFGISLPFQASNNFFFSEVCTVVLPQAVNRSPSFTRGLSIAFCISQYPML